MVANAEEARHTAGLLVSWRWRLCGVPANQRGPSPRNTHLRAVVARHRPGGSRTSMRPRTTLAERAQPSRRSRSPSASSPSGSIRSRRRRFNAVVAAVLACALRTVESCVAWSQSAAILACWRRCCGVDTRTRPSGRGGASTCAPRGRPCSGSTTPVRVCPTDPVESQPLSPARLVNRSRRNDRRGNATDRQAASAFDLDREDVRPALIAARIDPRRPLPWCLDVGARDHHPTPVDIGRADAWRRRYPAGCPSRPCAAVCRLRRSTPSCSTTPGDSSRAGYSSAPRLTARTRMCVPRQSPHRAHRTVASRAFQRASCVSLIALPDPRRSSSPPTRPGRYRRSPRE